MMEQEFKTYLTNKNLAKTRSLPIFMPFANLKKSTTKSVGKI